MPSEDRRATFTVNPGSLQQDAATPNSEKFHIRSLSGVETISQLFRFDLVLVTECDTHQPDQLINQNVTISLLKNLDSLNQANMNVDDWRYINGVISHAQRIWKGGESADSNQLNRFRVTVVPNTWNLTNIFQSRVFDQTTAWDIVAAIAPSTSDSIDIGHVNTLRAPNSDPNIDPNIREHCIQYRETDMNFISRLLEEEGISYYYKQGETSHQLVLSDGSNGFDTCAQEGSILWLSDHQNALPQQYRVHDYKFTDASGVSLDDTQGSDASFTYDFPGTFGPRDSLDIGQVQDVATWRSQEQNSKIRVITATSESVTFTAGAKFDLAMPTSELDGKRLLIVGVTHELKQPPPRGFEARARNKYSNSYTNRISCVLDEEVVVYRPPRITPKPEVKGPQTAVVEGPTDAPNGVHTDDYGRVKVKFHWDGRPDDGVDSTVGGRSAWVRVSEGWAGDLHGTVFLPHVGDEVIVDFLEGNPDRPIVTGRVYNSGNPPVRGEAGQGATGPLDPYKSIIKDRGGNEIIMDSTPNSESITLASPNADSFIVIGTPRAGGGSSSGEWTGATGATGPEESKTPYEDYTPISVARIVSKGQSEMFQVGNKIEGTLGNKAEILVGNKYDFHGGFALEGVVGGGVKFQLGQDIEFIKGPSYSRRWGPAYEHQDDDTQITGDGVYVASIKKTLNLIGGVASPVGSAAEDDTAVIELNNKFARMSVGANKTPESGAAEKAKKLQWKIIGTTLGALVAKPIVDIAVQEAAGGLGYLSGFEAGGYDEKKGDAGSQIASGAAGGVMNIATTIAQGVVLAVIMNWAKKLEKLEDGAKVVSHADSADDKPKAMVDLNNDGSIEISGTTTVELRAVERVPHDGFKKMPQKPAAPTDLTDVIYLAELVEYEKKKAKAIKAKATAEKEAKNGPGLFLKQDPAEVKLLFNVKDGGTDKSSLVFKGTDATLMGEKDLTLEAKTGEATLASATKVSCKVGTKGMQITKTETKWANLTIME
jgi:type VI secretion system VgrG family protein